MRDTFGARLRQRREQQNKSLAAIAEQTKIKGSLLEALERDDVSQWPSGIFRRAFARAYARALDLDPDATVREFLELYPDPIDAVEPVAALASGAKMNARPPTRMRYLISAAIDALSRLTSSSNRSENSSATEGNRDAPRPAAREAVPVEAPKAPLAPVDLPAVARLCTELGCAASLSGATRSLQTMADALGAVGLIVWIWDSQTNVLAPTVFHGYSDVVVAQLPRVLRDADNATAAAFRSAQASVVNGNERANGALAVPLNAATGCVGVLAIELPHRPEEFDRVQSLALIFAAQLARIAAPPKAAEMEARPSESTAAAAAAAAAERVGRRRAGSAPFPLRGAHRSRF
jgi:transcriptional regulator with XRE-family HTH domain